MALYPYKALVGDEIRLLSLLPGVEGEIKCTIHHEDLHSAGLHFTALSYTWGDASITRPIRLDGQLFEVTTNLFDALNYMRDASLARTFWIDAICINQADIPERNSQVLRMRDIYSLAATVEVWLGKEEDDSVAASDLVAAIAASVPEPESLLSLTTTLLEKVAFDFLRLFYAQTPEILRGLNRLFLRPWWTRVWVVQELSLADQTTAVVTVGRRTLPWRHYLVASKAVERWWAEVSAAVHAAFPDEQFGGFAHGIRLSQCRRLAPSDPPYRLLELLHQHRDCLATDPRDKVYGLLGMSGDGKGLGIRPRYEADVETVYREVAEKHIAATSSLDILAACRSPRKLESLPSWVPDWSTDQTVPGICINERFCGGDVFEGSRSAQVRRYSASGSSTAAEAQITDQVLSAEGFVFGEIVEIGLVDDEMTNGPVRFFGRTDEKGKSHSGIPVFDNWCDMLFESKHWAVIEARYGGLDKCIDAFCRVIIGNRTGTLTIPTPDSLEEEEDGEHVEIRSSDESILQPEYLGPTAAAAATGVHDEDANDNDGNSHDEDEEDGYDSDVASGEEDMYSFQPPHLLGLSSNEFRSCIEISWGKRLAIFDTGFIGIAPGQSRQGDAGVVLSGCSVPLVVRKHESSSGYSFMGESYVHGVSEGELMLGFRPVGFTMRKIHIS